MDDVKKKVLLDIFASPWTLVPIAGGLSAWLVSWGMDGNMMLNLAGLAGVLGGMGAQAARLIFGLERFTEDAYRLANEKEQAKQEESLDQLEAKLRRDGDPRTQECLKELRRLYRHYQDDVQSQRITSATHVILEKLDNLFRASVQQLAYSLELYREAKQTAGETRAALLRKREAVIDDVVATVRHVRATTAQFRTFQLDRNESELSKLRRELDATIEVARKAEQRIAEWSDEAVDPIDERE
ncbi:MAG: hypothetical protein KDA61_08750 [Planctomycetales bacterium]|nr:hypothetical protein [Planctomycetales bacterium]